MAGPVSLGKQSDRKQMKLKRKSVRKIGERFSSEKAIKT